ncbi:MAG: hypothetical protein EOP07_23795, partial [Proteobacteria bacterium]
MKILIIPISLSLLHLMSCKSLRSGYDVKDPSPNIGSSDSKGDKIIIKEDGTGKTSTTPEIPHSIPTPPIAVNPPNSGNTGGTDTPTGNGGSGDSGGTGGGDGGGTVQPPAEVPNETIEPIIRPTLGLAPDPMSSSGGNGSNTLLPNQELTDGQSLKSSDGRFTFLFKANGKNNRNGKALRLTNDGKLAIYTTDGTSIWTSGSCCFPPASAYDERPIAVGKWGPAVDWPIMPIHSILMPNGKVLSYGTDSRGIQGAQLNYDLWTPSKGTGADSHQTLPNTFKTDIFCGSPIILPQSGDALLPGGDMRESPNTNAGIDDTLIL